MGFISDADRQAHTARLAIWDAEERNVRPILVTAVEKVAQEVIKQATRRFREGEKVEHIYSSTSRNEDWISRSHYEAALRIHAKEPSLLIDTVDRILGMQHGKDYNLLELEKAVRYDTEGYDTADGLYGATIHLRVVFTPPLT